MNVLLNDPYLTGLVLIKLKPGLTVGATDPIGQKGRAGLAPLSLTALGADYLDLGCGVIRGAVLAVGAGINAILGRVPMAHFK